MRIISFFFVLVSSVCLADICGNLVGISETGVSYLRENERLMTSVRAALPRLAARPADLPTVLTNAGVPEATQTRVSTIINAFRTRHAQTAASARPYEELAYLLGTTREDAELLHLIYSLGLDASLSITFGYGNRVFSFHQIEAFRRENYFHIFLWESWLPNFSVEELCDVDNTATARFRQSYGRVVDGRELIRLRVSVDEIWKRPLVPHRQETVRAAIAQFAPTVPLANVRFPQSISLADFLFFLHRANVSVANMARILGVTETSLRSYMNFIGIERMNDNEWNDADRQFLTDNYDSYTRDELARMLGRSLGAIGAMADRLGLTNPQGPLQRNANAPDGRVIVVRDEQGHFHPLAVAEFLNAWVGYDITERDLAERLGTTPGRMMNWRRRTSIFPSLTATRWPVPAEPPARTPAGYVGIPNGRDAGQWRAEMKRLCVERLANALADGSAFPETDEQWVRLTGYMPHQILGIKGYSENEGKRPQRFSDNPADFYIDLAELIRRRTPEGESAPHGFTPFHEHLVRSAKEFPAYRAYLLRPEVRRAEQDRIARIFVAGFRAQDWNLDAITELVGIADQTLLSRGAYRPTEDQGHLGRFRGLAEFVDAVDREVDARLARYTIRAPRNAAERRHLAQLPGFTPWLFSWHKEDASGEPTRDRLFDKHRPRLQNWVLILARNEQTARGGRPSVARVVEILMESSDPLRASFSTSTAVNGVLLTRDPTNYRRIFLSLDDMWTTYAARP